ncbi:hypothetical protein [Streptomyces erythrochromogenes]|uniref:hypothetical protein n=1 Tax=Streptomyces erythrochromogenes TaxID=285574 RepID=UPI0036742A41
MSTKRMGITKKAVAATAIALGLAAANTGSAGAAGYPEYVTFNNQHFDVHFRSGGCHVQAKFSYTGGITTNNPTWVSSAVRSGESTCNLFVYTVYKGTDGKLHSIRDSGRRNVWTAGRGLRCYMVAGVQRPDFTWYSQTLWSTNRSICAGASF